MKAEELEDRLHDAESVLAQQGKRIKELEEREIKLPEIKLPDNSEQLTLIQSEIQQLKQENQLAPVLKKLNLLTEQLSKEPKSFKKEYHFLLFPETNQGQYYKIVFGRLIPWGIILVIFSFLFSLADHSIEAWGNYRYNQQAEQCVKAWIYMDKYATKSVKKAMDKAWLQSRKEQAADD